jgi:hypothetical protein
VVYGVCHSPSRSGNCAVSQGVAEAQYHLIVYPDQCLLAGNMQVAVGQATVQATVQATTAYSRGAQALTLAL